MDEVVRWKYCFADARPCFGLATIHSEVSKSDQGVRRSTAVWSRWSGDVRWLDVQSRQTIDSCQYQRRFYLELWPLFTAALEEKISNNQVSHADMKHLQPYSDRVVCCDGWLRATLFLSSSTVASVDGSSPHHRRLFSPTVHWLTVCLRSYSLESRSIFANHLESSAEWDPSNLFDSQPRWKIPIYPMTVVIADTTESARCLFAASIAAQVQEERSERNWD